MRADLGHDDTKLAPGDLLRAFINDLAWPSHSSSYDSPGWADNGHDTGPGQPLGTTPGPVPESPEIGVNRAA
jgi:hypothetical protein